MSDTNDNGSGGGGNGGSAGGQPNQDGQGGGGYEHLNIKVTDNNNEVFFKIKRSTKLEKLMNAFCDRQGKSMTTVRFLFDGQRVQPADTPDSVSSVFVDRYLPVSGWLPISRNAG